jgi:hypothetical protein
MQLPRCLVAVKEVIGQLPPVVSSSIVGQGNDKNILISCQKLGCNLFLLPGAWSKGGLKVIIMS